MTRTVLEGWERSAPATEESLRTLERLAGGPLPSDYAAFVRESDGAKGSTSEGDYVELWNVRQTIGVTEERRAVGGADGLLFFGGDGSREMLAFDLSTEPAAVVLLDITYESVGDSPWRLPSFTALLDHLATKSLFDPPG